MLLMYLCRSALDRDLILKLTDQLRTFLAVKQGSRLTISQLRQTLMKEAGIGAGGYSASDATLNMGLMEVEEAVKELESEGILQYIPRTQTAIIRTGQSTMQ